MTGYSLDSRGVLLARQLAFHDPAKNDLYWGGSLLAKNVPTPLADFATVSSPDIQAVYRNETPQAFSCTLRWCVKTMSATFSQGVYHETAVSTFTNDTLIPDPLECQIMPDGSQDWLYHNNITLKPPNSTDTYFIRNTTMLGARFALDLYIPNSIIQINETTPPRVYWPPLEENPGVLSEANYNNLWLAEGEAPKIVDHLATEMTTALRNDPRHGITVYGSGMYVTYIDVEWAFFSFPLIVLFATMVLLGSTILQTTKTGVWKTSDLTTLVHGLSPEAKEQLKDARSMQEVRSVANGMNVHLTSFENGRQLQMEQKIPSTK
jgi:hypothetical protein